MKDFQILTFENNILIPKILQTTTPVSGTASLVQRIIKCLFTVPGSDILNPEYGVGLQYVLPNSFDSKNLSSAKMSATEAIIRGEKQIKEDDSIINSPPSERLASMHLKELSYDASLSQWLVDITIKTAANTIFTFRTGA